MKNLFYHRNGDFSISEVKKSMKFGRTAPLTFDEWLQGCNNLCLYKTKKEMGNFAIKGQWKNLFDQGFTPLDATNNILEENGIIKEVPADAGE